MVVIVTRPASAGRRLFERLVQEGYCTRWWPAFDIGDAPDPSGAREMLARLNNYDLAIFVSASAVRAAQPLLNGAWPTGTRIGAVGASTRDAVAAELKPPAGLVVAASEDDQRSGSEAFWGIWLASKQRAHRVLLVRAQDGRNWLGKQFEEQGAEVDVVAVYSREVHRPSSHELHQMHESMAADQTPVVVFSSTEAVTALDRQIDAAGQTWLRRGIAIACHPRIGEQLLSNGYARVLDATFDDDSIVAQLESIGVKPQAP